MESYPAATLALFAYEYVTVGTHVAVMRETRRWPNLRSAVITGTALISRSRSRAASSFLTDPNGGEALVMVDHDIAWQPGDLRYITVKALESGALVAGIYPKREFGHGSAVRTMTAEPARIGEDRLIEAVYLSAGFMAIPRTILETVAERLPVITDEPPYRPFFLPLVEETNWGDDPRTEYLSEDWAFTARVREAGFPILAALKPQLVHEGRYVYRMVDAYVTPPATRDVALNIPSIPAKQVEAN